MNKLKRLIAIKLGETIGRESVKSISDFTEELGTWSNSNPFDAKNGNPPNEDEYMKEHNKRKTIPVPERKPDVPSSSLLQKNISNWSEDDLNSVMQSSAYQFDKTTQEKVQSYFNFNYPDNVKYDATGRMITTKKRKSFI